jgi:nucleoside-diphosphate-sugar epimerase
MLTATVIGARGFVGSAFIRQLKQLGNVEVREVTRDTYSTLAGTHSDIVIDAAANSKKFLAERSAMLDFEQSVAHRLRTLHDFPADCHLHISSVDVYNDLTSPMTTGESVAIDFARQSHYGFNKLLAEQLVQHHAKKWLILRLAGMVGEGLRKNPVFDILNGRPLFISPDSRYQFMLTDEVASIAMVLFGRGISGEIFNLCGDGVMSPLQVAEIAGRKIHLSQGIAPLAPRIVDVNVDKIKRLVGVTSTYECIRRYLRAC